jgi:hypothetical protein
MAGIVFFAAQHIRYLIWNLRSYAAWRGTGGRASSAPRMPNPRSWPCRWRWRWAINVGFILGLVFVPGLWRVVEYLFPCSAAWLLAVGAGLAADR